MTPPNGPSGGIFRAARNPVVRRGHLTRIKGGGIGLHYELPHVSIAELASSMGIADFVPRLSSCQPGAPSRMGHLLDVGRGCPTSPILWSVSMFHPLCTHASPGSSGARLSQFSKGFPHSVPPLPCPFIGKFITYLHSVVSLGCWHRPCSTHTVKGCVSFGGL